MPQEKDFSIISVNEDDADEVVIQAGFVDGQSEDSYEESTEDDILSDDEAVQDVQPQDDFHETTLEDLKESGPFNKMRLAILIGGIVLVVVAVVSFQLMR